MSLWLLATRVQRLRSHSVNIINSDKLFGAVTWPTNALTSTSYIIQYVGLYRLWKIFENDFEVVSVTTGSVMVQIWLNWNLYPLIYASHRYCPTNWYNSQVRHKSGELWPRTGDLCKIIPGPVVYLIWIDVVWITINSVVISCIFLKLETTTRFQPRLISENL